MTRNDTVVLTVYSRSGCHLCEDMISVLADFEASYNFSLNILDIDDDQGLFDRFNVLVPALYLGDREICHHFLDMHALAGVLDEFRSEQAKQLE